MYVSKTNVGDQQFSNTVRYFPIVFFELFLLITVIIFAFGPYEWPVSNPITLYSFLLFNQAALLVGYVTAIRGRAPKPFHIPFGLNQIAGASVAIVLILLIPSALTRTGGDVDVVRGLTDPGAAYTATRTAVALAGPAYVEYARMFFSPMMWSLLPLTVVFWNKIDMPIRWLAVIAIVGEAFIYVLIGTNKGVVDDLLLLPWLLLIRSIAAGKTVRLKRIVQFLLILVVAFALFVPTFGRNIVSRSGKSFGTISLGNGSAVNPIATGNEGSGNSVGEYFMIGYTALSAYVGQGYYGLSLSLEEPFVWTYGVGHSRVITWLTEKAVGVPRDELASDNYATRVETDFGWDSMVRWCSLYPWLAGDVTFFGVPVVMFLIGRLFALTWIDAIGGNPVAVTLFSLTLIMIAYISANAQVFQASDTVMVFYFSLFWWMQSRASKTHYVAAPRAQPRLFNGNAGRQSTVAAERDH